MTVINMLSFGKSGVAVADEQSTSQIREYKVAQKLRILNGSIVYGGSGNAEFLAEVYHETLNKLDLFKKDHKEVSIVQVRDIAKAALYELKLNHKNDALAANLGINLEAYLTGVSSRSGNPLDSATREYANAVINRVVEILDSSMLIGGMDKEEFKISLLSSEGHSFVISRPYSSIGSGSDESDKVLSLYVAGLPREKRESIDVREGLVKIIEATNAASNFNVGVGGSPSIVHIDSDGIKRPGESKCILASELVKGLTRGYLGRDFVYENVQKLVLDDNAGFRDIEEEMKSQATNWDEFSRVLRGYKE